MVVAWAADLHGCETQAQSSCPKTRRLLLTAASRASSRLSETSGTGNGGVTQERRHVRIRPSACQGRLSPTAGGRCDHLGHFWRWQRAGFSEDRILGQSQANPGGRPKPRLPVAEDPGFAHPLVTAGRWALGPQTGFRSQAAAGATDAPAHRAHPTPATGPRGERRALPRALGVAQPGHGGAPRALPSQVRDASQESSGAGTDALDRVAKHLLHVPGASSDDVNERRYDVWIRHGIRHDFRLQ
ncbi:hypothetical protein SAMN02745716_2024 [Thermoleophilum album]|uniref:Uncharacterized protein n=1 Tax=Thermoleophilum album TaxID=29539 RepID=A0A1H6FXY6_THEAL|nr:hypothetical protein SAMN02745716_2024 [Thermoleophilum album]